jgi:ElaB/YqjD/DUF883 family membrane-anchored ribosome-binding protein
MTNKTNSKEEPDFRQRTHEKVDMIMDKAESMRDHGNEEMTLLKENAMMMKENVDGYIRKNPEKSLMIAAGVGAVAGAILVATIMRRKQ